MPTPLVYAQPAAALPSLLFVSNAAIARFRVFTARVIAFAPAILIVEVFFAFVRCCSMQRCVVRLPALERKKSCRPQTYYEIIAFSETREFFSYRIIDTPAVAESVLRCTAGCFDVLSLSFRQPQLADIFSVFSWLAKTAAR